MQRIDKLSDYEKRGVAGVVMNVFQPLLHDPGPVVGEQLYFVTAIAEYVDKQLKMNGEHHRAQNGVFFLHLLCKQKTSVFIVNKFCHYKPPFTVPMPQISFSGEF